MGTGVSPERIITGNMQFLKIYTFKTEHKQRHHKIFLLGQALDLLVLVSWTRYRAYTSNLSTSLSLRDLTSEEWEILSWGGLHA